MIVRCEGQNLISHPKILTSWAFRLVMFSLELSLKFQQNEACTKSRKLPLSATKSQFTVYKQRVQMCKFSFAKNLTTLFILVIEIGFAKIIYFISWTSCKKKCKTATLANYVKTVAILASMQKELQKLLKTLQFLADLLITSSADCISFLKHFLTIST